MMRKISWIVLIAITLLAVYLIYETDANYLEFIKALNEVEIIVRGGELQLEKDSAKISFTAEVVNSSPLPMWVEAFTYHVSVNGQYAGAGFMEQAEREELPVPAGRGLQIPLQVGLRAGYFQLFLQARATGEVLVNIGGNARTGFEIGRSVIKAFYPVGGVIWKEGNK